MKLGIGIISAVLMSALCTEAAIFMKYDDIEGESQAVGHEGEIEVLSFSWGVSNSGSLTAGGGAGVPKFQDLVITKRTDKSSPLLMLSTATGKTHPRVILTLTRDGEPRGGGYYTITLEEVFVTSFQTSGSGSDSRPTESLSLNYTRIKFEYTPQKADGSADTPVVFGWDIKANKAY